MRRIGGILFLVVLAACDKGSGQTVAVVATTTVATTPPETSTSTSTSTSMTTSTTSTTSTTTPPRTVARVTTTAAPVARVTPTSAAGSGCDPNYSGACVPIDSDVDCSRSANGPSYVDAKNFRVVGRDIYGLDADGDGIACES